MSRQLEAPTGNSVRTTAFPQPEVMNLKINLGDPHALRIISERMLLNPATICPIRMNEREGKREKHLTTPSRSLIRPEDEGNGQSASPRTKAYRLRCISVLFVFSDFRKDVNTRCSTCVQYGKYFKKEKLECNCKAVGWQASVYQPPH